MLIYRLKQFMYLTLVCLVLLCLIITTMVVLAIGDTPLPHQNTIITAKSAQQAKQAIQRNIRQLGHRKQLVSLKLSNQELQSIIAIGQRTQSDLRVKSTISTHGISLDVSKKLSMSYFGSYLNISIFIPPSNNHLELSLLKIGQLELSGRLALYVVDNILTHYTGTPLLSGIKSITTSAEQITINYSLPAGKLRLGQNIKKIISQFSTKHSPFGNALIVRHYYQKIIETANALPENYDVSLVLFIRPLFQLANQRSKEYGKPNEENRAALLAITMYFGLYRIEYFIGQVLTPAMREHKRTHHITLAQRRDLAQHFIYSSTIEIFSNVQASDLIGELKELLDTSNKGSGFSFIDLMADRAGVRFSQLSTNHSQTANTVQRLVIGKFSEADLFPSIADLPEGLTQQQFDQDYQHLDSVPYLRLLSQINQHLETIPLYRLK